MFSKGFRLTQGALSSASRYIISYRSQTALTELSFGLCDFSNAQVSSCFVKQQKVIWMDLDGWNEVLYSVSVPALVLLSMSSVIHMHTVCGMVCKKREERFKKSSLVFGSTVC